MLNTQCCRETALEAVMSHLEVLKKAGLVAF
jgi:predicted transcriptional regulator